MSRKLFHSFIHSVAMCRMWWFLAVLRSFFHSSLVYTLSFLRFPPTSLPSSLTSSCHLFLDLPLNLVFPEFIYNTPLGILLPSILSISWSTSQFFFFQNSYIIPLWEFYFLLFPQFLCLPVNLVFPKFIYNAPLGILFSSILCTCPNQHNPFNLTVFVIVGF